MYTSRKKGSRATLFKSSFPPKREISRFRESTATPAGCYQPNPRKPTFLRFRDIICTTEEADVFCEPWHVWKWANRSSETLCCDSDSVVILDIECGCLYVYITKLHFYNEKRTLDTDEMFEDKIRIIRGRWSRCYGSKLQPPDILIPYVI